MGVMANRYTVTASGNGNTRSLKVTIPAEVCREMGIEAGDVFWVDVDVRPGDDGPRVVLQYVRTSRAVEAEARARTGNGNGNGNGFHGAPEW